MQALDELVLEKILVDEFLAAHDQREIDARIPERVVPDERLEPCHSTFHLVHHLFRHFEGDALYVLEITVVGHSDLHIHR